MAASSSIPNINPTPTNPSVYRAQEMHDKLERIIEEDIVTKESCTPTELRDEEEGESSGESSGHITVDLASPSHRDYSWVAQEVVGVRSVYGADVDMSPYKKYVGKGKQEWMLQGVANDEHVASFPTELKFSVYLIVLRNMHIPPPFTRFQQQVLRLLNVAPSQLHPNGWAFARAFELVMLHLNRTISASLFFHIFEVNRRHETGSDGVKRTGHVSLRSKRGLKIFRLYSESLKENWKKHYFFVSPVSSDAIEYIGKYDEQGDLKSVKFPIGWSKAHFSQPPSAYHFEEKILDAEDRETLEILTRCAKLIPQTFCFDTQALVHAKNKSEVQEALENMAGNLSFAQIKALASKKKDGSSSSKLPANSPAASRPEVTAAADEKIETPKFRLIEEKQSSPTTQGSPPADLKTRKRGKRLQKEGGLSSPQIGGIIVDLELEDSPPPKKSRLAADEGLPSQVSSSLERFSRRFYEEFGSNPFEALGELVKHGADLHAGIKQETVTKIQAVVKEKDEALNLAAGYRETLEMTSTALEKAQKEKQDLAVEKEKILQDKLSFEARAKEAEERAIKAEERASKAEERAKIAESDLATSTIANSDLRARVAELESQITETTQTKDAEISSIAEQAITLAEQAFANALAQVAVLHPNIHLDTEILKAEHEVRDGKIGIPSENGTEFNLVDLPPKP